MNQIKNIFVEINGRLINVKDLSENYYKAFQKQAEIMQTAHKEKDWIEKLQRDKK